MKPSIAPSNIQRSSTGNDVFKAYLKLLPVLLVFFGGLCLPRIVYAQSQFTHNFSTPAALSGQTPSWPWNTTATINVGGVEYELNQGGNGSWENKGNGGASNSASLHYSTAATTLVTLKRKDGQKFKFYGLWLSYDCFGGSYTPPHLTVTYTGSSLPQEKFNERNRQGLMLSKDVEVSSVTFYFSGLNTLYLDNLVVGPAGTALSSNANLSNLTLSGTTLSPAFNANTVNYTASVANAVASVTVTPAKADANATVSINGTVLTSGITSRIVNLNVGANTITTVVTAQNGSTKTYTLTVTRAPAPVPAAPSIPDLSSSSDTGLSNNDNITSDNTPSFVGTATSNTTIKLYASGTLVGTSTADGAGNWAITPIWGLADGVHTFTARAVDVAGNESPFSAALNVTIDTRAPNTTISSFPASTTNATNATFNLGSDEKGSYFVASLDGGMANSATSPLAFSGLGEGSHTLRVQAIDVAGNIDPTPASYTWTVDRTAPAVTSITRHNPATANINGSTVTFLVSFSEGVTGVDATDFSLATTGGVTGSVSGVNTSGSSTWQVTVSGISGSGTLRLDVKASGTGITDAAWNGLSGGYTTGQMYTVATTPLTASITSQISVTCNGNSDGQATVTASGGLAPYTYSWSAGGRTQATATGLSAGAYTVTVTDAMGQTTSAVATITQPAELQASISKTDVSRRGGSDGAAAVVVSGGTAPYTYTWSPSGGTGATASGLPAGTYTLVVTDANLCSLTRVFTISEPANTAPIAVNDSYSVNRGQTLTVPAPGLLTNDSDAEGSPLAAVLVSGPAHGALTLSADGSFTYTHNGSASTSDSFSYRVSDGSLLSNTVTVTISVITPPTTVASINLLDRSPTNVNSLRFAVTFATSVTGLDASDFTLATTGTADGRIASVTGSGTSYTVQLNDVSGDGTLRLDFTGLTGVTPNISTAYTSGQSYILDTTSPVITSVSVPANATYSAGQHLDFTINFSESLTVATENGTPALGLMIGMASRQAAYISGSGTTALHFRYTVQPGEVDMDGIALSIAIALNSGTITDAIGNAAVLSLNGVASTAGVLVDAVAPTITSISLPDDGTYNLERERYLFFSLEFSENMQHLENSYLELRVGTEIRKATRNWAYKDYASYEYVVQEGEQGAGLEVLALKSDATMPTDMQGNTLSTGSTFPILRSNVRVDGIRPFITGLTVPANKTYRQGEHLDFTVRFSEKVELRAAGPVLGPLSGRATTAEGPQLPEIPEDGQPFIPLRIGDKVVLALFNGGNGTAQLSFRYTVLEGELDMDGIEVEPRIVTVGQLIPGPRPMQSSLPPLGGFTITDLAGNQTPDLDFDPVPSTAGVLVDAVAPSVAAVTAPANRTYRQGESLLFTVAFTEPVTVTGAPVLQVVVGEEARQAVYQSGSGTSTLVFSYTVGAGEQDSDGISFQHNAIALSEGTIADAAGNASRLGFGAVNMTGVLVDAVGPSLSAVRIASGNSNSTLAKAGDEITLEFVASEEIQQPTVQIAGHAVTTVAITGQEYRSTYTMTTADSEGIVPFTINYQDLAGTAGTAVSATTNGSRVTFDKTAPTGTLVINGGATHTSTPEVTLSITATDALTGVAGMRFSNDNMTWSAWQPLAASKPWNLPATNGNRQVHAQLRDGAGNTSSVETQIILDTAPLTLTLSSNVQTATNKPFEVFFTFSKVVTGFTISDLTLVNAWASNLAAVSGEVYKATITPASEGEVNVSVAAGVAVDAAGNLNAVSNTLSTLYDLTQPMVTLASMAPGLVRGPFEVTLTFSEEVAGFTLADIAVTKGTASALTQVGNKAYAALITPNQEGEVVVSVVPDAAQDAAGNSSVASLELIRTFDNTSPTLVITTTASNPTNAPFDVTFTFSEEVSGFEPADIAVANGTASNLTPTDDRRYSARITPAASGEVTVSVAAEKAQDAAGNLNSVSNILKMRYDAEKPTVVLATSVDGAVNAAFPISLTFSKEMSSLAAGSIAVTNGTVSSLVKTDARTYTALVMPVVEGRVEVSLPADAVQDAAGNGNQASNSLALVYDITPPVTTLATSAPNPTNRGFEVSISFSEKVSGLALRGIAVTNGTLSGLSSTDNQNFTVQLTPSTDGEVSLSIPASIVKDGAGNGNLASTELVRRYDATRPQVTVASTATSPVNAAFTAQFIFTEAVAGFDLADITVSNGAASDFNKVSATAYTALITPASNGEATVAVAAGKVKDEAGNGNLASKVLKVSFDTIKPTLILATAAPSAVNAPFKVSFTFSKAVTGFDISDITVINGSATDFAVVDSRTYTLRVIPAADGEVTVSVPADAAMDAASNGNLPSNTLSLLYDAAGPAVVLATAAPDPTNRAFQVSLAFSEPVSGFTGQSMVVANATLSAVTTMDNQHFTFEVTPLSDGLVTLSVPEGVVADAAGNRNTASETLTRTFNATRPALTLTTNATSPINAAFEVTFTFSKEVTGFEVGDIDVNNGTAAAFTQVSAQVYTARITPDAEGEVILHVMENVAHDRAGNGNTEATALKLSIDKTQPTVALASSAREKLNAAFEVSAEFSETVTGFAASDVTVANGTVTGFSAKGDKAYTLQITPQAGGEVRVSLAAGVAHDAAGNPSLASEQLIRFYDSTRPAVEVATAVTSPVNAAFAVRFFFSEAVESFELANITVENGSVSDLTKESPTLYSALVTPGANGSVTVAVAENQAQDAFGNGNLPSNRLQVSYDVSQPTLVLSTTGADVVKAPFEVTFTFSKEVTGFALEDIAVANGSASALKAVSRRIYTALVTPHADGEVSIAVAADVARDAAGNGNQAAGALTRIYDATRPALVLSTGATSPTNEAFEVVFTFSEPVSGFALEIISVAGGVVSGPVTSVAGKVYRATIAPSAEGEVAVSVAADVVQDKAGNGNLASNVLRMQHDKTRPTVILATTAPSLTNVAIPLAVEFSEQVTGFDLAAIQVSNGVAADLKKVSETKYSALVTPARDGEVSIALAENKVTDAATNGNTASNQLSLTYDGTAPAGYTINWGVARVDVSNLDASTLSVTGAELGTTYTYRITSGQESTAVSGTGEVAEETFRIANLDLDKLKDGQLTVRLYLTDKAGNRGEGVTAQVLKVTRNIASVTAPEMIQVPIRTTFEQVPLPATVGVTYSTGETAHVKVQWETGAYDGTKAGQYVLTGTLEPAEMTTNLDSLTASILVEVQPNKAPTALAFSATTFKPEATADEVIGTLSTTDPDDSEFVYTLASGEGDTHNALFEIRGDQVYLESNKGLSGMTTFTIRVRSTDPYLNTIERSFTLTKQAYDRTVDQLKIVNAFSPNGDGINDHWTIPELRFYNEVHIQVFDRSGVRVFDTRDPETGWNGRSTGGQILKGPFLYIIEVKDINWVKRGVVTILSK